MPRTGLVEAVKANNVPRIQELLNVSKDDLDEDIVDEGQCSDTANDFSSAVVGMRKYKIYSRLIDIACEHNHFEAVELLLKAGSRPTKRRDSLDREDVDCQPLFSCKISGDKPTDRQYKILKLLIMANAELKDLPSSLSYPLDLAIQQDDQELFDFLYEKGERQVSGKNSKRFKEMSDLNLRIFQAISEGRIFDQIDLLINKGANLQIVDQDGNTLLLIAALAGQQHLVNEFIYRVNNQATNKRGHRLLHCAVIGGLLDTVKRTLNKSAINDLDTNGETLLSLAIRHGRTGIAEYLLGQGAKDLNDKKCTLLHQAVRSRSLDTVKFVLEKFGRRQLNDSTETGDTALALAIIEDEDDIANYLLQQKADIFVKNSHGKTIFELKDLYKKPFYKELMFQAANGYINGFEIEQDISLAEKYYLEAARLDHPQAQFELSEFYRKKYDYFLAVKWQHRAALNQHLDAQFQYGKSLLYGMGITKNLEEAKQWLTTAANRGHQEAKSFIENWDSNVKNLQAFKTPKKRVYGDLELYRTSEKSGKRVKVPEPVGLHDWWRSNRAASGKSQKNEIAVNVGLIFTDRPHKKGEFYDLIFETLPFKIPGKKEYDVKDLPTKTEEFFEHAKKRIKTGEGVYEKYKNSENKLKDVNFNFFERKHKDTNNPKDNHFLKHSEQCYYEYLNSPQAAKDFLQEFIKKYPSFKPGSKVYGVVLDFYSLHCMCPNCKIATIGIQNPEKTATTFLNNLEKELLKQGYKVLSKPVGPNKTHLKMVTRIHYDEDYPVYDEKKVLIKHVNCSERDIRFLDNMEIFEQKHSLDDQNTYTVFKSGT